MTDIQFKDIKTRVGDLYRYLDIEKKLDEIGEMEDQSHAPGFWDDPKAAEVLLKQIKQKIFLPSFLSLKALMHLLKKNNRIFC